MDPHIWGPSGWIILHRLSFLFKNIDDAEQFYKSLEFILPCPSCRYNYKAHSTTIKFPKGLDQLPKWVYKMHNKISKSIGKKKGPSFKKVVDHYDQVFDNIEIVNNETKFLYSLLYTFSKNSKNIKEYVDNLNIFIVCWCKFSNIEYTIIKNKTNFKKFICSLSC